MESYIRLKTKKVPANAATLMGNAVTRKFYEQFIDQKFATELRAFLRMLRDGRSNMEIYNITLKAGAPRQVNIGAKLRQRADILANAEDWENPEWTKILAATKAEVLDLLDRNFTFEWRLSTSFRDLAFYVNGTPAAAAKHLGLKGDKAKKKLAEIIHASAAGRSKRDVEKLIGELRKENKMRDLVTQIKMSLELKGFIYLP